MSQATLPHVLKLLDAYRILEQFSQEQISRKTPCGQKLREAQLARFEVDRKRFNQFYIAASFTMPSPLETLLMQLDPVCIKSALPDFETKSADTNACYAGTQMILSFLQDVPRRSIAPAFDIAASQIDAFLPRWTRLLEGAKRGDWVDLGDALSLPQDVLDGRQRTLALLALLYASPGSRVGYASPFGDVFWTSPLKLGQDPVHAYNQYMLWRSRKDEYYRANYGAFRRGVRIRLGSQEFTKWNHHAVISAFLACDFRSQGMKTLAKLIPDAMGYVYESHDFISHLSEGVGWEKSRKNFSHDTQNHLEGARFGYDYCAPHSSKIPTSTK